MCAGNAAHPTICIQETLQPHGHNVSFLVLIHTNAILAPDSLQESMGENGAAAVIALGMIAGLVVPAPVRAERHFPPTTPGAYLIGQPRAPVLGPAPGLPNLMLDVGQGALGFTLAMASGRVVADLLAGRAPPVPTDGCDAASQGIGA